LQFSAEALHRLRWQQPILGDSRPVGDAFSAIRRLGFARRGKNGEKTL
jgi:hypothetical protein